MKPNTQALRDEAFRAVEAIDERYFDQNALEGCIKTFARHIYDLADALDLHHAVAHAAWHLMDDSGELRTHDDNGVFDYMHGGIEHERLSAVLDALEASGWDAHPVDGPVTP